MCGLWSKLSEACIWIVVAYCLLCVEYYVDIRKGCLLMYSFFISQWCEFYRRESQDQFLCLTASLKLPRHWTFLNQSLILWNCLGSCWWCSTLTSRCLQVLGVYCWSSCNHKSAHIKCCWKIWVVLACLQSVDQIVLLNICWFNKQGHLFEGIYAVWTHFFLPVFPTFLLMSWCGCRLHGFCSEDLSRMSTLPPWYPLSRLM